MAVKLIATDLDGTLMAPDHMTVTERTKNALLAAHNKGIKIAIATGRTLTFTDSVTAQIPFADYVVSSNGAAVYDRNAGEYVYSTLVPNADALEAVEFLNALPVHYHIYMGGRIYIQKTAMAFAADTGLPEEFLADFISRVTVVDDLKQAIGENGVEVIDVFSMGENEAKIVDFFKKKNLVMTSAVRGELAATALGADKGTALGGLCGVLGITPEEAMTFGDAENDCPMLEFAGLSFAMENGNDICKKAAKAVAPSNAVDGVAQMIEKYCL
ncbi:MAG: HAD family phosphatase [Clostridia bacterium]|nr:HAD family phosphatase [Clostridia bacterium]